MPVLCAAVAAVECSTCDCRRRRRAPTSNLKRYNSGTSRWPQWGEEDPVDRMNNQQIILLCREDAVLTIIGKLACRTDQNRNWYLGMPQKFRGMLNSFPGSALGSRLMRISDTILQWNKINHRTEYLPCIKQANRCQRSCRVNAEAIKSSSP